MKHGTQGCYINHKCRCPECTIANTESCKKYRASKFNKNGLPCSGCGESYPDYLLTFVKKDTTIVLCRNCKGIRDRKNK